jgi:hypothetical protein
MAALTLRLAKGSPLTNAELDSNFSNLNTDVLSRLLASSNLSDLTNAGTARANLGLGNVENKSAATILGELSSLNVTTALGFTPQVALTSGTNIKTVNGVSVLGSGNIQIDGGVVSFNTRTGAVTLSSGDVTTALGFTPLSNATSYLPLTGGTLTGNITLNAGTANGVPYLNGSKVLTTGSALTFDGSNLGLGVTPSAWSSIFKAIDIGTTASFVGSSGGANLFNNAWFNGSNYIYKTTAAATRYLQSSGAHQWFNAASGTAGNAITFTQAMTLSAAGGLSLGTTADPGAGAIFATGNITAYYSDDRLKTKLGGIENALDKVDQLSGFYYEANETAQALGYKPKREVGVSAQQVQAVMPEVVSPAPIDQQYLTVNYERLVPLLIEAIKELRAEVR